MYHSLLFTAFDYAGNAGIVYSDEFVVDSSPPVDGNIVLDDYVRSSTLRLHMRQFYDPQSGIGLYKVGIGSRHDVTDILQLNKHYSNDVEISLDSSQVIDGHTYFVIAQVWSNVDLLIRTVFSCFNFTFYKLLAEEKDLINSVISHFEACLINLIFM